MSPGVFNLSGNVASMGMRLLPLFTECQGRPEAGHPDTAEMLQVHAA